MKLLLTVFISCFSTIVLAQGTVSEEPKQPIKAESTYKPISIVTTIKPLSLLVKQIIDDTGDNVYQLLSAGSSPHHYQLNISDRKNLQSADLVLWVGPALESFLEKPLLQRKSRTLTASMLEDIHWVFAEHDHHDHHNEEGKEEQGHSHDRDPHLWLDPYNLGVVTQAITAELINIAPQNTAKYQKNSNQVLRELATLDETLQIQLKAVKDQPFIVMHPAYSHFVQRYGLSQQDYMVTTPERGIGAKHLYQLKKLKPTCVFGEEGENTKLALRIASSAKAGFAELDPLGYELSEDASATAVIEQLARDIQECLSKP